MIPELIAILGIGVALAGLLLRLNARIDGVASRLNARIDGVESHLSARIDGVQAELREVRDRLSRLEGKMDILRDYIMRRNDPAPAAE